MKTRNFLLIILALIAVSFFAGRWSTSGLRSAQYDQISTQDTIIRVYRAEVNNRDQIIYEKNQLIGTQREAIKAGIIERDLLKATGIQKASQITSLNARLRAARDSIDLSGDSVIFVTDTIDSGEGKTYIPLPFSWSYSDQWLSLNTGINLDRQAWFRLEAPTKFNIVLGGKDGRQVSAVTTPSKYITVTDFDVVRLKQEKWYYKPWVPSIGGFVGGVATGWLIWGR